MMDSTLRFSSRADNYAKYRPSYPAEVIETLRNECCLSPSSVVADIGSGTGVLAELFLRNGNRVYAVEPNSEMRKAAELLLQRYPEFRSVAGKAEATGLNDKSVDFAVVAQAFHWFDTEAARLEFLRILKPEGWGIVVWNEREFQTTPFLIAYDQLLRRYAPEYAREKHRSVYDNKLAGFFGSGGFITRRFCYQQEADFAGVRGRMMSSSYTPEPGHPNHEPLMKALRETYQAHQVNDHVSFDYITWMYFGRLNLDSEVDSAGSKATESNNTPRSGRMN
jgi:SAM-dependent methyltransferase